MGASDGYVVGTTKVVDHGPNSDRWNLVIVGDGYRLSELNQYHTDVQSFLTTFRTTAPFNELFCGINVHRVDVVSNESGADIPACAGGTPVAVNSYFDATFCSNFAGSPMERLLTIDSGLATTVATTQVPERHQVLCIVNSSKYGGAGGAVATCSTHGSAAQIAIHEIGHSAFGLADEYGGNGSGTPAGEPSEPNVTRNTNRNTNKWRTLIAPTTPMPSACDGSCASSTCVAPASAPAAGAVGTYEGGIYANCNTYRPLPDCYMRTLGTPFCPVCAGVIRQTLQPFLPTETINLLTPSINFFNVPAGMGGIGVTTQRAIVWEVRTCRQLTFQIINGPSGGFGVPAGTSVSVTADPTVPLAKARLWLSYTSTNPGDLANGQVTVRCNQTGQTWLINISANTIARPRAAVALVLDRSGSMNEDAGDAVSKVQKLREAANTFISLMPPNDGIGIVRFNDTAQRLMEIQEAGVAPSGPGRTTALNHIMGADLNPGGNTSIGDGVVKGKQMLDDGQASAATPYDVTAEVVLTDGMWNQPPSLNDVGGSLTATSYAVGLGLPSNISVGALTSLCQGNNGYLLVTGAITPDQSMRLSKYFVQILAGVTNAQIAADPAGMLDGHAEHRIPFWINEADYGMDVILLSPFPYGIELRLEAPDGTIIDAGTGANSRFVLSNYVSYYRCALPVLPANGDGSHAGLWHALLRIGTPNPDRGWSWREHYAQAQSTHLQRQLPYELVVHSYSSLTFDGRLTQKSFEVGATAKLTAIVHEYDVPRTRYVDSWAEVVRPDGSHDTILLTPTAEHFEADYSLLQNGLYRFRLRARGQTTEGTPFEREKTLTAVAVPGGDQWSPDEPKIDQLCEWLRCLRKSGALDGPLAERFKAMGIDLHTLLACMADRCRQPGLAPREPQRQHDAITSLSAGQMKSLVRWVAAELDKRPD
ncbi:MAG: VWA domain-containing protein [Anaerolineales bacterium]|nr:VWA domain-containing protein [Anaerolineales bacterium]MCB9127280.1 VWA domain-containing protein [Ardenticatenales bacterium]MCB9172569.1 VWA domain-containing protein [Ardenticatenales bacterium]